MRSSHHGAPIVAAAAAPHYMLAAFLIIRVSRASASFLWENARTAEQNGAGRERAETP